MRRRARITLSGADADTRRAHIVETCGSRWHFTPEEIPAIALVTKPAETVVAEADDLLRLRFAFRGASPPVQLTSFDWTPPRATTTFVWDLNRHNWFTALGLAHAHTGDPKYVHGFAAASDAWVTTNAGRLTDLRWDGPFEVAARINAWIWAHSLFGGCREWQNSEYFAYVDALGLMTEYLYQTIEFHDSGNHILLEAKALAMCADAFPHFSGAPTWRAKAWATLDRELRRQVLPDGVHAERSSMYHRIVAGELAELWCLAVANRRPEADRLGHVVRRMAAFDEAIAAGDDRMPLWGDASSHDTYFRFYAPAVVAAVDAGTSHPAGPATDLTPWVHRRGRPRVRPREALAPVGSRGFGAGGYYVSRSGTDPAATVLVWDCGPVGFRGNTKHSHVDVLSWTLTVAGTPLLIDPGTSTDDRRREHLRSSRSHNTVTVDGQDQAVLAARSEVVAPPAARLRAWGTSGECDIMAGSHDGYARLVEPVRHTRTIVVVHGTYVLVVDDVDGDGDHAVEARLHFAPELDVRRHAGSPGFGLTTGRFVGSVDTVDLAGGRPVSVTSEQGHAERVTGVAETIPILVARQAGPLPITLATVVVTGPDTVHATPLGHDDDGVSLQLGSRTFEHVVSVSRRTGGARRLHGDWTSDALVAVVRSGSAGTGPDVLTAGATCVLSGGTALRGRPLRRAPHPRPHAAPDEGVVRWVADGRA